MVTQKIKLNYLFMLLVLVIFMGGIKSVQAGYCIVSTNADDVSDENSLRHIIETVYNNNQDANCTPPKPVKTADNPKQLGDHNYFDQSIIFTTKAANKTVVSTIKLNSPITFSNSYKDLVVGKWSPNTVNDPSEEVGYSQAYINVYNKSADGGLVTIDAKDKFSTGKSPFKCGTYTQPVYLRNMLILTNQLSKEEFLALDSSSCIYNAGYLWVCGENYDPSKNLGEEGWCKKKDAGICTLEMVKDEFDITAYKYDCNNPACSDKAQCKNQVSPPGSEPSPSESDEMSCVLTINSSSKSIAVKQGKTAYVPFNIKNKNFSEDSSYTFTGHDSSMSFFTNTFNQLQVVIVATSQSTPIKTYTINVTANKGMLNKPTCSDTFTLKVESSDSNEFDKDDDGHCDKNMLEDLCPDGMPWDDCDDDDASINPKAKEKCGDGVDNNCNGKTDEGCVIKIPPLPGLTDDDGDGFCEGPYCTDGSTPGDCDDNNPEIHPDANEICGDGVDNNCNGNDDEECSVDPGDEDKDGDGFTPNENDCNDNDNKIHPNATELCTDMIDNNCDGYVNEGCKINGTDPTIDDDKDGFCEGPVCSDGSLPGDCNDLDPKINPGMTERCDDNVDNNCDGVAAPNCQVIIAPPEPESNFNAGLEGGSGCSLQTQLNNTFVLDFGKLQALFLIFLYTLFFMINMTIKKNSNDL